MNTPATHTVPYRTTENIGKVILALNFTEHLTEIYMILNVWASKSPPYNMRWSLFLKRECYVECVMLDLQLSDAKRTCWLTTVVRCSRLYDPVSCYTDAVGVWRIWDLRKEGGRNRIQVRSQRMRSWEQFYYKMNDYISAKSGTKRVKNVWTKGRRQELVASALFPLNPTVAALRPLCGDKSKRI